MNERSEIMHVCITLHIQTLNGILFSLLKEGNAAI